MENSLFWLKSPGKIHGKSSISWRNPMENSHFWLKSPG
jgi:hypothetical protein